MRRRRSWWTARRWCSSGCRATPSRSNATRITARTRRSLPGWKLPTPFQLKIGEKDYDRVVDLLAEHGWVQGILIANDRWYRFHRGERFVLTGVKQR